MLKTKLLAIVLLIGSTSQAQVVYEWAKAMGSTGWDNSAGITTDASGNVYTTGYFSGTVDFDPGAGTANLTSAGDLDIFITKFNAAGNFIWAKRIGGSGTEFSYGLGLDASGNVYATGTFSGTVDFDPGAGTANLTSVALTDIFIIKLDAAGNYVWAKKFGFADERVQGIAVDASGNVYTTGTFLGSVDFDPGPVSTYLTSAGDYDIFVSKLDASGNFQWARNMGGANGDYGNSIAVDASGNVYTTGTFAGTADFDPGAGTQSLASDGSDDIFISKLNASGIFVWAKRIGNSVNSDYSSSIAVDASGNVFTTGTLEGTVDFDPGAGTQNLTSAGNIDIFISKLDAAGNYVWAKKIGDVGYDSPFSLTVDAAGAVYTTGYFDGTADFDPGAATHNLVSAGGDDIFISKLDAAGNYVWAASMGGTDSESGVSIAVNGADKVYVTGYLSSAVDFDPGTGTQNLSSVGDLDIFIAHYDGPVALPLTLLQLQANNDGSAVQIQWQTTQEENTASFSIERSANGHQFAAIGSVPANNTAFKNNYTFPDAQPLTGTAFYRLKMIDIDGKFTYSSTVSVKRTENSAVLLVTPIPAKDILYVQAKGSEQTTIQIADVNGRILQQQKISLNGTTSFSVNIQSLPAGSYYLILKGRTTNQVQQFLKK